jgi:hypothetical protein
MGQLPTWDSALDVGIENQAVQDKEAKLYCILTIIRLARIHDVAKFRDAVFLQIVCFQCNVMALELLPFSRMDNRNDVHFKLSDVGQGYKR